VIAGLQPRYNGIVLPKFHDFRDFLLRVQNGGFPGARI
jgi:hypothetical protein